MVLSKKDLPKVITINGTKYRIDTDFRTWIKVCQILNDKEIQDRFKLIVIAETIGNTNILQEDYESVYDALISFYQMYQRPREEILKPKGIPYSFSEDMWMIYSAFRQQYGINLYQEDMHWFEFKAMFDSLTDDTLFVQVQGYRTQDTSKLPKEQKETAEKLKRYWRIEESKIDQKDPKEIEAELLAKAEAKVR